jgi:hypothetical protein
LIQKINLAWGGIIYRNIDTERGIQGMTEYAVPDTWPQADLSAMTMPIKHNQMRDT